MDRELIAHIAFSIQDETLDRRRAQAIVRSVLTSLRPGDRVGPGLVVRERSRISAPALRADPASDVAAPAAQSPPP